MKQRLNAVNDHFGPQVAHMQMAGGAAA